MAVNTAHLVVRRTLAERLRAPLHRTFQQLSAAHVKDDTRTITGDNPVAAGQRALKNLCLDLLVTLQCSESWRLAAHMVTKKTEL